MVIEVGAEVGSGTPVLGTLARVLVVRLGPMGTLTQVQDTPSRPHATTTPYDPSPPRRATTTHDTTQVKTPMSPFALY